MLGIPVAVKDEAGVAGCPGTFGCLALRDQIVATDAVHTQRLRAAGAVILGTTNLPEFGHRATTVNRLRGPASTPFRAEMNAGGSSGGSAAAVAAGMAVVAHGSDGGGSVRIPAAMCGLVGLIGTYGRVPRVTRPDAYNARGNFAYDGVLARSTEDALTVLRIVAGHDRRDPFAMPAPLPALPDGYGDLADLKLGWSRDLGTFPVEPDVAERVRRSVAELDALGARVE